MAFDTDSWSAVKIRVKFFLQHKLLISTLFFCLTLLLTLSNPFLIANRKVAVLFYLNTTLC